MHIYDKDNKQRWAKLNLLFLMFLRWNKTDKVSFLVKDFSLYSISNTTVHQPLRNRTKTKDPSFIFGEVRSLLWWQPKKDCSFNVQRYFCLYMQRPSQLLTFSNLSILADMSTTCAHGPVTGSKEDKKESSLWNPSVTINGKHSADTNFKTSDCVCGRNVWINIGIGWNCSAPGNL